MAGGHKNKRPNGGNGASAVSTESKHTNTKPGVASAPHRQKSDSSFLSTISTSSGSSGSDADIDSSPDSPTIASRPAALRRELSDRTLSLTFLPDAVIARHWIFRFLVWLLNIFYKPFNGYKCVNFAEQPRDKAILFYCRHSTHNSDILTTAALCWEETTRVSRMLLHRAVVSGFPWLRYVGGTPGERKSAVALLKAKFWCGVIPGGADEGLVGHENCYQVVWPKKRVGFAKVAMEGDALIVPFFARNNEESRWNPFHAFWHLIRGYVLYEYLIQAKIPLLSTFIYKASEIIWFMASNVQIPIPVRVTIYFGDPVPYDKSVDTTDDVVQRSREALQALIAQHQPNWKEGRNYTRALTERWNEEWRVQYPRLTKFFEVYTPAAIKKWLRRQAQGKKRV